MNKEERKAKFLELLELAKELETTFLAGNPEAFKPKCDSYIGTDESCQISKKSKLE